MYVVYTRYIRHLSEMPTIDDPTIQIAVRFDRNRIRRYEGHADKCERLLHGVAPVPTGRLHLAPDVRYSRAGRY